MKEFEDSFEYNETGDQAQAIADVKRDNGIAASDGWLLCGDVGYGKTECDARGFQGAERQQAGRGAGADYGARVQHYETFKQRFAPFPLTVEMISRFRTPKQVKEILGAWPWVRSTF